MATDLVTGGWGFVGGHLVEGLVAAGRQVVVLDEAGPPPDLERLLDSGQVVHRRGDVRDADAVRAAMADGDEEVDVVYHLAAVVGVDRYLERPLDVVDVNVVGTRQVLEAAARIDAKVVLASTSEIFGRNPAVPWKEDDDRVLGSTAVDRWSYSTSKALAEHLVLAFARAHGLRASVVRFFNAYGPRQRPAFIVARTLHRTLNGLPPVVYDGGRQSRCFTFVEDAVAAVIAVGSSPKADGECFNIGTTTETTVADLVGLIGALTGMTTVEAVDTSSRIGPAYQDLQRRVPDVSKLAEVLDVRCSTPLRDGLETTLDWARRNPWWCGGSDSGTSA